jgi:sortase A
MQRLRHINTALLIAIVCINGYIIALPVLPGLLFWMERHTGQETTQLEQKITKAAGNDVPTAEGDQLIIPSMLLDQPVHTGRDARTLRQGLWLRPQGSTPDKGGNTVIVGHRFTYTNPRGTLYHLDKVRPGDSIGLTWQGKAYTYTVRDVKVVKANAVSIEAPTDTPQLTIYTCTPLWLPKDRLVVIAEEATL